MWGEVIKNCRTLSRLIWIHIPPKLSATKEPTLEDMKLALAEKKAALGLIEGYAVALKHHLRGEMGLYYVDLYHLLVRTHRTSLCKQSLTEFLCSFLSTKARIR